VSATDLANHLACRHLTELNRAVADGRVVAPTYFDAALEALRERGLAHERGYVASLAAEGRTVVSLSDIDGSSAVERTRQAMRDGADVIVQASLEDGIWRGRADVLLRVSRPSDLGEWSYEVADTKLAQETRGGTVLQLCLYSDLVARIQGLTPERMYVVKPGDGFPTEPFRVAEYDAYYRVVRQSLEEAVAAPPSDSTYPVPTEHCSICRWWQECDARRHADDHLSLVAGLRNLHIVELERQGMPTLREFAENPTPLRERPSRGSEEAFAEAQGQAQIQLEGRLAGELRHRLLPPEPGMGLARLPEPSPGDVFFDIESDPFVLAGGLEYLLGVVSIEPDGSPLYRTFWGTDRVSERQAFESFIDFVMTRLAEHPGMHVFHFSPYEPAALKRLMGRHGKREPEMDRLLRGGRFIDLLAVTRQGLRASVESYSLKELEQFFAFARAVPLRDASAALRRVAWALEFNEPDTISDADRETVRGYNEDDCLATRALRDWLEHRRAEALAEDLSIERPPVLSGDPTEAVEERAAELQVVFDQLVAGLPEDRELWSDADRARWLLANQLEYFHREDRCAWWEYFRIRDLDYEALLDERKAITGLEFVGEAGRDGRSVLHRYRFSDQEAALDPGDDLEEAGKGSAGLKIGAVFAIDQQAREVVIKKRGDAVNVHPAAVMTNERVTPSPVNSSHLAVASAIAESGLGGPGPYQAARDLLMRRRPRLAAGNEGPLVRSGETVQEAAIRLARSLDGSVLPIQGPPGTGKTYTGAQMILALARDGKRVGVTAVSHKVIRNLLDAFLDAGAEAGLPVEIVHKVTNPGEIQRDGLEETKDNGVARDALVAGNVVGGTAWFWSRDDMAETADYLFVDEAGQMSLAHVLAASRSARNLILLGDPQQLEQPQRGAHPEGAEVAALVHVLDGRPTILGDAGLFLGETWRLHPTICEFTSELYYEGRLTSLPGLALQTITGPTRFAGSGLVYVPVEHAGNQNRSIEEVDAVQAIVADLLRSGVEWVDRKGDVRPLRPPDILVVAPYNSQVGALRGALPGDVRVGTVDKFQGQEAPVVIYSMASSSAEDAPRGMGFLYDPHRLNVATSRARCVCILVASPRLFQPDCRTPEQMRLANGLCKYREMATEVVMQ
jgi:uncharacterized protein